jgi:uncharacterized protein (TIRG00374 family)
LTGGQRLLRVGFGLTLLTILAGYFDVRQIANTLTDIDLRLVTAAALLIAIATVLGAINAYLLVDLEGRLTYVGFLPLYWLSWAVGLIFPGQVGDVASLAALLHRRGIKLSASIGRSLADKLVSFVLMLTFAAYGLATLPSFRLSHDWLTVVPVFLLATAWCCRRRIFQWLNLRYDKMANFAAHTLHEVASVARNHPRRLIINIVLTTAKVVFTGASYWCVFRALGYEGISLWPVIFLAAASSIVAYLPISFNGIGTVEVTGIMLFSELGLPHTAVLSGYLALRVAVLLLAWIPAGLWLLATLRQQHRQPFNYS